MILYAGATYQAGCLMLRERYQTKEIAINEGGKIVFYKARISNQCFNVKNVGFVKAVCIDRYNKKRKSEIEYWTVKLINDSIELAKEIKLLRFKTKKVVGYFEVGDMVI